MLAVTEGIEKESKEKEQSLSLLRIQLAFAQGSYFCHPLRKTLVRIQQNGSFVNDPYGMTLSNIEFITSAM